MQSIVVNGEKLYPTKIVCVGRNYVAHIEELGNEMPDEMVLFNKPNSAISDILRSQVDGEVLHYESELSFVIKDRALHAVGFGLDLTKRELQSRLKAKGLPWERAKAFDGSVVFSEFVTLPGNLEKLVLELQVDGSLRQSGGVELMIHKPRDILEEVNAFTSLEDGDVIMTGTPAGVGSIHTGERFEATVRAGRRALVRAAWVAQ